MKNKYLFIFVILTLLASGIFVSMEINNQKEVIAYTRFIEEVEKGQVKEVHLTNSSQIKVELNNGNTIYTDNPRTEDFKKELLLHGVNAREKILKVHSKNKPISKDVNLKKLAQETVYFSGAKLENLLNESAMIAVKDNQELITNEHINKAYYKVLVGDEKKDRSSLSSKDREITAYHEAGHALVAKLVSSENRVTKVSIIPSTKGMGGFSLNIPPDRMYKSKKEILNNIMVALGGRAAEEIIYGEDSITTGASSDLEKATEMALSLIGIYGMDSKSGLISLNVILSMDLKSDIDIVNRAREILESMYLDTKNILMDSKGKLDLIASALLEKEALEESEIDEILNL